MRKSWPDRGAVAAQAFDQDGRRTAEIFGAYEKLLYDSKPWTLMICSSGQRVCCAIHSHA